MGMDMEGDGDRDRNGDGDVIRASSELTRRDSPSSMTVAITPITTVLASLRTAGSGLSITSALDMVVLNFFWLSRCSGVTTLPGR